MADKLVTDALLKAIQASSKSDSDSGDTVELSDRVKRLLSLSREKAERKRHFQPVSDVIKRLRSLQDSYLKPLDYEVGDIVVWKDALKNRIHPDYHEPVIVVEIFDEPVIADHDSGTAYFREKLTVKLGWLDSDDEFICFHYDGNRFRKRPESE